MKKRAIIILYDGIAPTAKNLESIMEVLGNSNTIQTNGAKVIMMDEKDISEAIVSREIFIKETNPIQEEEKTAVEQALTYLKHFFKAEWSKPELIFQKVADIEKYPPELKVALEIISNKQVSTDIRRKYEYRASIERVLKLVAKLINK